MSDAEVDRASGFDLTQQSKDTIKAFPFLHCCIDLFSVIFTISLSKRGHSISTYYTIQKDRNFQL